MMLDDTDSVVLFALWRLIILMLPFFYGSGRWYPFEYLHKRNKSMISGQGKANQCLLFLYFEEYVLALWLKMSDVDMVQRPRIVFWPTNTSSIFCLHRLWFTCDQLFVWAILLDIIIVCSFSHCSLNDCCCFFTSFRLMKLYILVLKSLAHTALAPSSFKTVNHIWLPAILRATRGKPRQSYAFLCAGQFNLTTLSLLEWFLWCWFLVLDKGHCIVSLPAFKLTLST